MNTQSVFDSIERHIGDLLPAPRLDVHVEGEAEARNLSLSQVRRMAFDRTADESLRTAIWRRLTELVQRRESHRYGQSWLEITIWTALPALRPTASRLGRGSSPAHWEDIQAEMVLGVMEVALTADPLRPDLGSLLCRTGCTRGWQAARVGAGESPVEDIDRAAGSRSTTDPGSGPGTAPDPWGIVPADPADPVDPARIEGERLGALAYRMQLEYLLDDEGEQR